MKRILCLVCAVLMIVLCFAGCGDKKDAEKTTFTVGFDAEFPPYGYLDVETNEYTGFDLVLAEEVCKRNGWELEKKPIDWDSKDSELDSGSIDCIWNGFTMNGRENDYTFSKPYVDNSQVVVVRKGEISDLSGLKGKSVEVQKESSAEAALTGEDASDENKKLAAGFKELVSVADYNTALMDLESGICDAVAMDVGVAKYKVEANDKLVMLDTPIATEQYAIGFKKGNKELCEKVQATLDEMVKDGTFEKIAKDWGLSDSVCLK